MKDARSGSENISGYLGEGIVINGEVHFPDILRIDGKVKGKLVSEKDLVVGETGEVDAEIQVGSLSVSGRVSGTVRVKDRVTIHAQGRVKADLVMERPSLVIEEGGVFEGSVDMNTTGRGDLKEVKEGTGSQDH